jgi:hypothetical protein
LQRRPQRTRLVREGARTYEVLVRDPPRKEIPFMSEEEKKLVDHEEELRKKTFRGITPGDLGYDALEDPAHLKDIEDGLLLGIFQGRIEQVHYNTRLIWAALTNANTSREDWAVAYDKLRASFSLDRDESVVALYKNELERRLTVGRKLAAAVRAAMKKAAGSSPPPAAPLSEG